MNQMIDNSQKETENKIFYRGKTDRVFKSILCKEENQRMLEWFLSLTVGRAMKIIKYLRNEQPINRVAEKSKIVDLLVELEGEMLHLELNNNLDSTKKKSIQRRNFMYVASDYVATIKRGEDYNQDHKMLAIDLSYGLGSKQPLYKYYYVQSEDNEKYIEDIGILVVNMDKVDDIWYNGTKKEKDKIKHLKMLNASKEELLELSKGDKMMEDFTEQIVALNENQQFRRIMSDEEEARMWANTEKNLARETGLREGKIEGKIEGKKAAQQDFINKLLEKGKSLSEISEMLDLPVENIQNILES